MRRGFGLIGLLVTTILVVIIGVIAYNIGWSDGVNTHLPAATDGTANVAPYYYGYGPHFGGPGFGLFGIFFFLLILFGCFWLFRIAFWGFGARRFMGGGGGWGYGPRGHWGSFEERAQEWHKRQHGETPPAGSSGSTPPPPPPDTRSV
ncbi:MAG TPA: hypothetical protein VJS19_09415 [Candidatus Dormibacteraeota bacterium]|nr:hypothetical protein [Candidatus Dormibacteraeota bacterium]